MQWVDCVWQMLRQYPLAFEFNERCAFISPSPAALHHEGPKCLLFPDRLLLELLHQVHTCRFGTFLYNTERERVEEKLSQHTVLPSALCPGHLVLTGGISGITVDMDAGGEGDSPNCQSALQAGQPGPLAQLRVRPPDRIVA